MSNLEMFYQKHGLTVRNISRDLLCLSEGDVMTSIAEYTEKFEVSRWTVQTAIQILLDNKCMKLERHGAKGTQVYDFNRQKLWEFAELKFILGFASPPSTIIHDSLYTGLIQAVAQSDLPVRLGYMVPAGLRMELLHNGRCNFVITSRMAYDLTRDKYPDICIGLTLHDSIYSLPFRLYARPGYEPVIKDHVRVGLYEDALEHNYLTKELCRGKDVEYKYGNYHGCREMLARGEIDVLVQRGDVDSQVLKGFPYYEIENEANVRCVTPVILCNENDYHFSNIIQKGVSPEFVAETQKKVISGQNAPTYY